MSECVQKLDTLDAKSSANLKISLHGLSDSRHEMPSYAITSRPQSTPTMAGLSQESLAVSLPQPSMPALKRSCGAGESNQPDSRLHILLSKRTNPLTGAAHSRGSLDNVEMVCQAHIVQQRSQTSACTCMYDVALVGSQWAQAQHAQRVWIPRVPCKATADMAKRSFA